MRTYELELKRTTKTSLPFSGLFASFLIIFQSFLAKKDTPQSKSKILNNDQKPEYLYKEEDNFLRLQEWG